MYCRVSLFNDLSPLPLPSHPLPSGLHPSLPRVGVRTSIPPHLSRATWLGRGPHECYADRRTAAYLGCYTSQAGDLHVPYIFPQVILCCRDTPWWCELHTVTW